MQHNDSYTENIYTFVNNINTPEGGTHLAGFKSALTKTFNDYAKKNKLLKENEPALSGEDIREGLTAIISVKIEEPQFEGQTKQKLGNSEARAAVDAIVSEQLTYFLEQNPTVRIVLPLVAPGIAAVAMLSFMYAWNEYTYTVIFTRTAVNNTVPLALALLNTEDNLTNFGLVAAGGVVSVIPITLFVIFAQNYLISGLSSGAVKE